MATDFQMIFEGLPSAYLILTPDFKIVAASETYLKETYTKREEIIGRDLFEVFPDNPGDPTATGVANLTRSLNEALRTKQTHIMGIQRYDIPLKGGEFEKRWWRPQNSPLIDKNGEVIYIVHFVEDITKALDKIMGTIEEVTSKHSNS